MGPVKTLRWRTKLVLHVAAKVDLSLRLCIACPFSLRKKTHLKLFQHLLFQHFKTVSSVAMSFSKNVHKTIKIDAFCSFFNTQDTHVAEVLIAHGVSQVSLD